MFNIAQVNGIIRKYKDRIVATRFGRMEVKGLYGQRNLTGEFKIQH